MVRFGEVIQKYRKGTGLSQAAFAKRIGVASAYVSMLENNRKEPSLKLLRGIAKVLRIPVEVLFWEVVEIRKSFGPRDRKIIEAAKKLIAHFPVGRQAA